MTTEERSEQFEKIRNQYLNTVASIKERYQKGLKDILTRIHNRKITRVKKDLGL